METIITSLTFERAVKHSVLYKEDDHLSAPSVQSIYLRKSFAQEGGEAPKRLGMIIVEMQEGESLDDLVDRFAKERQV